MQHIIGCYLFQLATTKCGSFPWPPKCTSLIHCPLSHYAPAPFIQLCHCASSPLCPAVCLSVPLSPLVDRHRASRVWRVSFTWQKMQWFFMYILHISNLKYFSMRVSIQKVKSTECFFRFSFWFWHFKSVCCPSVCRIRPVLPFEVLNFSCAFN